MEDTLETKKRKLPDSEKIEEENMYPCDQCEYTGSKLALYQHKQT